MARPQRPIPRGIVLHVALFVVASFASSASAQTAPQTVVGVLDIEFAGELPSAAREILMQQLVIGLQEAQLAVRHDAGKAPRPQACTDPDCFRELSTGMEVAYLVKTRVQVTGRDYDIDLEVINGKTGLPGGAHRQHCQICGIAEVGERMSLAASALASRIQSLATAPSRILIRSHPDGATVSIDGERRGESPVEVSLHAGSHMLRLSSTGHREVERELTVVGGVDHAVELDLVRVPSSFPYRKAGWSGVGGGAALLITGIVLLAMDGDEVACMRSQSDASGDCPEVLSTDILGATLMTVGAAAGTLGGIWLYLGAEQAGSPEHRAELTVGYRGRY